MTVFDAMAAVALLSAIVSIAMRFWETPPEIMRRVVALEIDLQQAVEQMSTWMKRENVRRAREVKEERAAAEPPPVDTTDRKAQLRAVARARFGR